LVGGAAPVPGILTSPTSVTFNGVQLTGGYTGGLTPTNSFVFSIQGLRFNASTMTQSTTTFANGAGFNLYAYPVDKVPAVAGLFNGSPFFRVATAAYAIPTFKFGVDYPKNGEISLSQCNPSDGNLATPNATVPAFPVVFNLNFTELFNGAFLTLLDENNRIAGHMGFATQGTRLSATFSGLPTNTLLWIPAIVTTNGLTANYVLAPKADGSGGTLAKLADTVNKSGWVSVAAGTQVVYEITASVPTAPSTLTIPVSVTYTGTATLAPATSGSVSANYAPQSSNPGATAGPIPRFSSAPSVVTGLYGVAPCSTTLLFPYITTQPGWNVGIAVANTGMDPFGHTGQGGTCAFNFYGPGAPAAAVTFGAGMSPDGTTGVNAFGDTTNIAPGTTSADVVSDAAGFSGVFRGYAIAVCNFQFAHGYAFVIGTNSKSTFAHGYLALVLQSGNALVRGGNNGQYEGVTY
jgi:hypothetical protein